MSVNDSWAELTGNQLWAISKDGSYYTLKNGMPSANSYLTAPASATNGEAVYTADSAGTTSQWILEPYTGEALNGVRKLSGALNLITGEELTYQICMYSSAVGVNGPVRYSVKNTDGTATDKATIEESTGRLTALKPGQIKIRATYTGAPYIWSWTATIEESMEGTWFIQNRHESLYMQVDDDDEPNYTNDGGIAEVRSFNGADYQKWIFTNAGDGYYKITSKISGYAVTVPSGEETEEDVDLVLKPYTGSSNQKWKITLTSYGSYKIKAKSSESITDRDLVMVVQTNILYSEGLNIQQRQYVDNTSYKDEWLFSVLDDYPEILLGFQVPSTTFSIQCIGSLAQGTEWNSLIQESAAAWNNTVGTNITVTSSSTSVYTCTVDSFYDDDWYGLTTSHFSNGITVKAEIQINARTCSNSDTTRKSTITHEIGHLLGLNDNPPIGANYSLMNHDRNRDTVYVPQPYDISNVKYIYEIE